MKRLPKTGSGLALPRPKKGQLKPPPSEAELKLVLDELGVTTCYGKSSLHELYLKLAAVNGSWWAKQEVKQVAPVAKALRKAGADLRDLATLFSGHQTGLRSFVEVHSTSQVKEVLAHDPTVGSIDAAHELLGTLTGLADKVSHACVVAYVALADKASGGRDRLDWYDEFTKLLFEIADRARIKPNLNKDRITRARGGWLFKAAQALETFLDPHMRSPSPEACGTRLERSRKRLLNAHRQNPKSK
jgi:hypothetical protein